MAQDSSPSKRSAKRRTQRKHGKRTPAPRSLHRWGVRGSALGIMVVLLVAVGFLFSLSSTVRRQFEGKRWALPARVYARPLELFAGMPLTPDDLTRELVSLGYRRTAQSEGPGSFTHKGDTVQITTHAFRFWDGGEPSVPVQAVFQRHRLVSLWHAHSGAPLPLLRLEG